MLHKSFQVLETKADAEAGTFEATVAIFGNVDRGGDRIMPGAFQKTLEAWKSSGDPIPVILSHQWDNPMAHIGVVQDAKETDKGLWVKGALDVADNDVARQVHRLMQRRSLKEFSFGYEVPKGGEKRGKDGANELFEVNLAEVGPTLKGMNPATELHAVKSALKQMTPSARSGMASRMREMADMMEMDTMPMSEAEMAQRMRAMASEMAGKPKADELQEVKARLDKLETVLENPKTQEGGGDGQGAKARSVDPLRQQAENLALEVASGGLSRRPPIKQAPPAPEPDLMDLKTLRQRSRDLMLQVLSGTE